MDEETVTGAELWERLAPPEWIGDPRRLFDARIEQVHAVAVEHVHPVGVRRVGGVDVDRDELVLLTRQREARDNGVWRVKAGHWKRTKPAVLVRATRGPSTLPYCWRASADGAWAPGPIDEPHAVDYPPHPQVARVLARDAERLARAEALMREAIARLALWGGARPDTVVWRIAPKWTPDGSAQDSLFIRDPSHDVTWRSRVCASVDMDVYRRRMEFWDRKLNPKDGDRAGSCRVWVKAHRDAYKHASRPNPWEPLDDLLDMGYGPMRVTPTFFDLVAPSAREAA